MWTEVCVRLPSVSAKPRKSKVYTSVGGPSIAKVRASQAAVAQVPRNTGESLVEPMFVRI